tara:strand:- start:104 stop:556 length:453 start_codon:yes stop_codon:yes gene_type:complete
MALVFVDSVIAEETISFQCDINENTVDVYKLGDKYESEFTKYYAEFSDKKIAEALTIMDYKLSHRVVLDNLLIDVDIDDTVGEGEEGIYMGLMINWKPDELQHIQFMGKVQLLVTINRADLSFTKFTTGDWSDPFQSGICEITAKGERKF